MPKILVTPRSVTRAGHPSLQRLRDAGHETVFCRPGELPSEAELLELLPGCVGYLAGVEPVTAKILAAAAPGLRAISRNGTGVDTIDLAAARTLGVRILRADGANARGVAELALALLLALARAVPASDTAIKTGRWTRSAGFELEGKTLGLVGCGRIGRLVTGFAGALGLRVLGYDPYPTWNDAPAHFVYASLDQVLSGSDLLSLHCPPAAGGNPVLDAAAIARLKRGVVIVNTARGGLIDTDAMLASLNDNRVAGLALDAFEQEPPIDRRLVEHPRVIATPHIGGFTPESIDRAMTIAVDNLLEALRTA